MLQDMKLKVLPEHPGELLASPSPEKPVLHVQVNDPKGELEQTAFESQTDGVMAHSLMSVDSNLFYASTVEIIGLIGIKLTCFISVE